MKDPNLSPNTEPIWLSEFRAALTETDQVKWREEITLAEKEICDRIEVMDASPASIDDLNERWALSTALVILRSAQIEVTGAYTPATQGPE